MSKGKTLVDLIAAALKSREGKRLTGKALSEVIVEENEAWVATKRARSKNAVIRNGGNAEMAFQVQSEIGSNKFAIENHTNLRMTEDRPRRYYYTSLSEEEEVEAAEADSKVASAVNFSESDMYPKLSNYFLTEHGIYSKRIDKKRSKNRNGQRGNQWLHPDLIGIEALDANWVSTIKSIAKDRSDPSSRLWSFEVKKKINRYNLRESFFQALSNSAWANFGYLVAAEVTGSGTMEELRMLSAQHGIGVITLSMEDDTESDILIQARYRRAIDWSAASRLCSENADAKEVFSQIRIFSSTGEITKQFWDTV